MEQTIKCNICGRPYKVYSHTVQDQTACPKCVSQAESMRQAKPTILQIEGMRALSQDEIRELEIKNADKYANTCINADI